MNTICKKIMQLSYREKFLFLLFSVFALIIWFMSCVRQSQALKQNWRLVNAKIKNHRFWIKNGTIVQSNLDKVLEVMDPKKTLSGSSFAGEVEKIIRNYHINYSMTSPRTRQGEIFNAHTSQLHCEHANLETLIAFEKEIYAKKPYLSLEKIKLHANTFNPEMLEADCTLSALQLKDVAHEK